MLLWSAIHGTNQHEDDPGSGRPRCDKPGAVPVLIRARRPPSRGAAYATVRHAGLLPRATRVVLAGPVPSRQLARLIVAKAKTFNLLDTLVELVVQRLTMAQDVAAAKYRSGAPVDDPVREQLILQSTACALNATRLDHQMGVQFFLDQVEANKVIQRGLLHHWHRHPEEVPVTIPNLATEVRPSLDRITTQMMQQFKCMDGMPRFKLGDITDLIDRRFSATFPERQLPGLHRHAAIFAMRSLCASST
jgi:chorismate mutase